MAELWIVAPVVVGSSPIGHPIVVPDDKSLPNGRLFCARTSARVPFVLWRAQLSMRSDRSRLLSVASDGLARQRVRVDFAGDWRIGGRET